MEHIRVAQLVKPGTIELFYENVEVHPGAGEATVRVKQVGICGTDIHIFAEGRSDVVLPRVMGHELSGEVIAIGKDVENIAVGDRVVLDPVMACGHCAACQKGRGNICAEVKCYGVQMDGGFRDIITVPAAQLYKIPEGVSYQEAALVEPFSIASNILNRAQVTAGEKLVIIGAGTIGLTILQGAKGKGLRVLIADIVDSKLRRARSLGADVVVHSGREDLKRQVAAFAPDGPDILVDAVGTAKLLETCVGLCGPMSRIVIIGFDARSASIAPVQITKKELTIIGSRMNAHRFPEVLQWFSSKAVNPSVMIDKVFPVEQIQRAFETTVSDAHLAKILISFE